MDIEKKAKNKLEVVKNLKSVVELILAKMKKIDSSSKIDRFKFHMDLIDENIKYDNYEEFLKYFDISDLTKFEGGLVSLNVNKEEKVPYGIRSDEILNIMIIIQAFRDEFLINISANDKNIIEEIFSIIFQGPLVKCKIYKYDKFEERKEKRKEEFKKINDIIEECIHILENLNSYQERVSKIPKDEKALQEFIFPILKSHFENLLDEFSLPKFASIEYKPDFGIPEAQLLIECKYIKEKKDFKRIQKEINDDIVGYLQTASNQYKKIVVLIYNSKNTPISNKFKKDFEKVKGVEKIIIVPGVTV